MAVTASQLQAIALMIANADSVRAAATAIRSGYPGLRATVVDILDVRSEKPAFSVGDRRVYMVESSGHCWEITRDPHKADGLILAHDPSLRTMS